MTPKTTLRLFLLLPMLYFLTIAQSQTTPKTYRILTYGLPNVSMQNACNLVSEKWHIQYYAVAGCMVSEELTDSVKKENDNVYKLIEHQYGKNWKDIFYKQIDAEYTIEMQIDSLVKEQDFMRDKHIMGLSPDALFPMHPTGKNGDYIVDVSTYNFKWEEQKLYKLLVNYKKNAIKIINDFTAGK